jgi:hypothetical protein
MEHTMIQLPAHFVPLENDELIYLDGGRLSEAQSEVLLWSVSALLASVTLVPSIYLYIFSPILSPVTTVVQSATDSVESIIASIFS